MIHGVPGDLDAWYVSSDDDGVTWSAPDCSACTSVEEPGFNLATSQDRGSIHVAYQVENTIERTWASFNAPDSWTPAVVVTTIDFAGDSFARPSIVADLTMAPGEDACVAWTDLRNAEFSGYDILFNRVRFSSSGQHRAAAW